MITFSPLCVEANARYELRRHSHVQLVQQVLRHTRHVVVLRLSFITYTFDHPIFFVLVFVYLLPCLLLRGEGSCYFVSITISAVVT